MYQISIHLVSQKLNRATLIYRMGSKWQIERTNINIYIYISYTISKCIHTAMLVKQFNKTRRPLGVNSGYLGLCGYLTIIPWARVVYEARSAELAMSSYTMRANGITVLLYRQTRYFWCYYQPTPWFLAHSL